ncbi:DDE-type integrase/transposase/recombinase [Streptomyces sp. NPDC050523]|uniref:DDE-type integrase/transposase/recombinase n=1 Tax=Streptomyces sp. NPDC050523 TaxID=3365622 RepID=UPI0037B5D412
MDQAGEAGLAGLGEHHRANHGRIRPGRTEGVSATGLTRPGKRPAAPDYVRRDFTAEATDLVWCGDMTETETGEGKLYLATVIDLFSRRLLGYAMGARHDAELVVAALHMAAATRGGDVRGVSFHTDRGSEYSSRRFRRACRRPGVFQSMARSARASTTPSARRSTAC